MSDTQIEQMLVEEEVIQLQEEIEYGVEDGIADYGQEAMEGGGWVEVLRAVVRESSVSPAAKAEVLRLHGVEDLT